MSSSPAFLKKIKDAFTISCLKFAVFSNSTSHGHHRPLSPPYRIFHGGFFYRSQNKTQKIRGEFRVKSVGNCEAKH